MSVFDLVANALRWFQGEGASKDAARDRLQLILIQDRSSVDPGILEALREDMMSVMKTYFDVLDDGLEVEFKREGEGLALIANIPIRTLHGRRDFQFSRRTRNEKQYDDDGEPRGPVAMPTDDAGRVEESVKEGAAS